MHRCALVIVVLIVSLQVCSLPVGTVSIHPLHDQRHPPQSKLVKEG